MNVLSLFDGIACGLVALKRADIKVDKYFASEIDKYAIQIAMKNHSEIVQLGDVRNWRDWNLPEIDLLIGGSPCQGFSYAGKQLNFEDERSKLFFDFVNVLRSLKPKYFLLENVPMKKEYSNIISEQLNCSPIEINSALVSAQSRKRLYWTNIDIKNLPRDKNLYLKDIVESGVVDRDKSYLIDANYFKGGSIDAYFNKKKRQLVFCSPHIIGKLSNYQNDALLTCLGKSKPITACGGNKGGHGGGLYLIKETIWRKLTPIECERLQTLDDNYTKGVSNHQRYKMLGNGWTIDIVTHIFSFLSFPPKQKSFINKGMLF